MASLAQVLYPPPTHRGWDEWIFWHHQHHDAIERGMAQVLGVQPITFKLYPFFKDDMQNWILEHQNAHSRFGQLLSVNTQDLSGLDFENKTEMDAWLNENYLEHLAAAQRLGTTIT